MPSQDSSSREFGLFIVGELRRWLEAFDDQRMPNPDVTLMTVHLRRKDKVTAMREKLASWNNALLIPECEDFLHAADSFDLEAVAHQALGGLEVVVAEQTAWFDEITETGRLDEYVQTFILEQKACGRKPSMLTDVAIKIMLQKLPDGTYARDIVNSLLSCNRRQDWEKL
jgi:hypothetical protein